jgi:hypothetical protein
MFNFNIANDSESVAGSDLQQPCLTLISPTTRKVLPGALCYVPVSFYFDENVLHAKIDSDPPPLLSQ